MKIKIYQQFDQAGIIKMLITISLTLETMRQPIIKPRMSSLGPWCRKLKKLKKLQIFLKIADIKILKNIPLHLETMQ